MDSQGQGITDQVEPILEGDELAADGQASGERLEIATDEVAEVPVVPEPVLVPEAQSEAAEERPVASEAPEEHVPIPEPEVVVPPPGPPIPPAEVTPQPPPNATPPEVPPNPPQVTEPPVVEVPPQAEQPPAQVTPPIPEEPPVPVELPLPEVTVEESEIPEEPKEEQSVISTVLEDAANFITGHLPHNEEVQPKQPTSGVPQKVLDLTDDELGIAYKYYLKKNQATRSANGIKKKRQIMNQHLTDIETYLKQHSLSSISKIARELNLSPNSVEHYLYLLRKQGRAVGEGWGRNRRFR